MKNIYVSGVILGTLLGILATFVVLLLLGLVA